jgi:L-ascorbate 6-phosphate lactonase
MNSLTLREIKSHTTPPGSATLWWLGQAGFIIRTPGGKIIALDPYLSDSCRAIGEAAGLNMGRQTPPPMEASELAGIDLYVLTHSHQDHLDPETLSSYRKRGGRGPYLAPAETIEKLHALGVAPEETRMIWPNKIHKIGDAALRATFAIPFAGDDLTHVGYLLLVDKGPTIYFTGDTAYHEILAISIGPHRPDVMVTVINGAFRNLGAAEAARLAKQLDPKIVIPCHHDLFLDNCQPPQMLRTNLIIEGIGERYMPLERGKAVDLPRIPQS